MGYSPGGRKESDTTEQLTLSVPLPLRADRTCGSLSSLQAHLHLKSKGQKPPPWTLYHVLSIFGSQLQKGISNTLGYRLSLQEFCLRSYMVTSFYS